MYPFLLYFRVITLYVFVFCLVIQMDGWYVFVVESDMGRSLAKFRDEW